MNRALLVDLVQHLPQASLSRAWGWLARRRRPKFAVRLLQRIFVRAAGIAMQDAEHPLQHYATLEALFVRRLRAGRRPVDAGPNVVVSPVDGTVGATGTVVDGTLLQVKGRTYALATLLGDNEAARRFEGGTYINIYLSPQDYHRVHTPIAGTVALAEVIPGGLLPVFAEAVDRIDGLFARNARIITYVDHADAGRMAIVKVGATLVGRIVLAYDPAVWSNRPRQRRHTLHYAPPHALRKGAEVGAFALGSTVVLLAERGRIRFDPIAQGSAIRLGQRIGSIVVDNAAG